MDSPWVYHIDGNVEYDPFRAERERANMEAEFTKAMSTGDAREKLVGGSRPSASALAAIEGEGEDGDDRVLL